MTRPTLSNLSVLSLASVLVLFGGCDAEDSADAPERSGDGETPCSSVDGCDDEGGDEGDDSEGDEGGDDEGGDDGDCSDTDHDDGTDTGETGDDEEESDLPYAIEVDIGDTVDLNDAFEEKGPLPAEVLEITMEDGDWRLDELQAGMPFVVDQDDCDHEGNRDTGRDRIFVTWENQDGSEDTDHIDLRYCGA